MFMQINPLFYLDDSDGLTINARTSNILSSTFYVKSSDFSFPEKINKTNIFGGFGMGEKEGPIVQMVQWELSNVFQIKKE